MSVAASPQIRGMQAGLPALQASARSIHGRASFFPRRGEIYYVDLDPIVGSEQGGHRQALILQNDVGNQYSPVTIVAVITSRPAARPRPIDVLIQPGSSGLQAPSRILLNQIRTIDSRRLGHY